MYVSGCFVRPSNQTLKYSLSSSLVVYLLNLFLTGSDISGLYRLAKSSIPKTLSITLISCSVNESLFSFTYLAVC